MKTSIFAFLTLLPCAVLGALSRHHAHRHQSRNAADNACMGVWNAYWSKCINIEKRLDCLDFVKFKNAGKCQEGAPGQASVVTTTAAAWIAPVPTTTLSGAAFIQTSAPGTYPPGSGPGTYHVDFSQNACNIPSNSETELVTSIRSTMFIAGGNANFDPICGRQIRVNGNGKSVVVKIIDKCGDGLDLSILAMKTLGAVDLGNIAVTWEFI